MSYINRMGLQQLLTNQKPVQTPATTMLVAACRFCKLQCRTFVLIVFAYIGCRRTQAICLVNLYAGSLKCAINIAYQKFKLLRRTSMIGNSKLVKTDLLNLTLICVQSIFAKFNTTNLYIFLKNYIGNVYHNLGRRLYYC